jgi:membrane protease YdiL (CAAX protease family)
MIEAGMLEQGLPWSPLVHAPSGFTGVSRMRTLVRALGDCLMAVGWTFLLSASLALPAIWAVAVLVVVLSFMAWVFVLRTKGRARRLATLRLRPIGRATVWIVLAILPCLAFLAAFDVLYTLVVGGVASADTARNVELAKGGARLIPVLLFVVVAAPMVEETLFRGWMQSRIQRRWGPRAAVLTTALLFALAHSSFSVVPIQLAAGLVFGSVVVITRSLWAGVLLHFSWNVLSSFGLATRVLGGAHTVPEGIPLTIPLLVLAISTPVMLLVLSAALRARRSTFDANGSSPPAARLHLPAR